MSNDYKSNLEAFRATWDFGWLRPYVEDGKSMVTTKAGVQPSIDEAEHPLDWWLKRDQVVAHSSRYHMPLTSGLLQLAKIDIPDAVSVNALEYRATTGSGSSDGPTFSMTSLPLPFTHVSSHCATMEEIESMAGRVAERIDHMLLYGWNYSTTGKCCIPGLKNYSWPLVKSINPQETLCAALEVLAAEQFYGPYMVICSTKDKRAVLSSTDECIKMLEAAGKSSTLVKLATATVVGSSQMPDGEMIMIQPTTDVVQIVVGAVPTLVIWNGPKKYRIVSMIVPMLRRDYHENFGAVWIKAHSQEVYTSMDTK